MFFRTSKNKPTDESVRPADMPVVRRDTDLEGLMQGETVLLFKHSAACPVSWMAHAHVTRFRSKNPHVPVHLVPVIEERATSLMIAERTRVRHESPQIILLRNGVVTSVASHDEITEAHLSGVIAAL